MGEYMPTTEDVRQGYARSDYPAGVLIARFDRWLAAHDAKVRCQVLREKADAIRAPFVLFRRDDGSGVTVNDWLREEARYELEHPRAEQEAGE